MVGGGVVVAVVVVVAVAVVVTCVVTYLKENDPTRRTWDAEGVEVVRKPVEADTSYGLAELVLAWVADVVAASVDTGDILCPWCPAGSIAVGNIVVGDTEWRTMEGRQSIVVGERVGRASVVAAWEYRLNGHARHSGVAVELAVVAVLEVERGC